jgi:hypothetical protein
MENCVDVKQVYENCLKEYQKAVTKQFFEGKPLNNLDPCTSSFQAYSDCVKEEMEKKIISKKKI